MIIVMLIILAVVILHRVGSKNYKTYQATYAAERKRIAERNYASLHAPKRAKSTWKPTYKYPTV